MWALVLAADFLKSHETEGTGPKGTSVGCP